MIKLFEIRRQKYEVRSLSTPDPRGNFPLSTFLSPLPTLRGNFGVWKRNKNKETRIKTKKKGVWNLKKNRKQESV
jgi:hypothetical protein